MFPTRPTSTDSILFGVRVMRRFIFAFLFVRSAACAPEAVFCDACLICRGSEVYRNSTAFDNPQLECIKHAPQNTISGPQSLSTHRKNALNQHIARKIKTATTSSEARWAPNARNIVIWAMPSKQSRQDRSMEHSPLASARKSVHEPSATSIS